MGWNDVNHKSGSREVALKHPPQEIEPKPEYLKDVRDNLAQAEILLKSWEVGNLTAHFEAQKKIRKAADWLYYMNQVDPETGDLKLWQGPTKPADEATARSRKGATASYETAVAEGRMEDAARLIVQLPIKKLQELMVEAIQNGNNDFAKSLANVVKSRQK